jgi:AAA15 family ATPase/GTPase
MYIKRVSIKNFRTLLDFEMELEEKFQIIAGANNSGKSNLLRVLNIFLMKELLYANNKKFL